MDTSNASHRLDAGHALLQVSNPRRTPSHLSISLPRSKRQKLAHGIDEQSDDICNKAIDLVHLTNQHSSSNESASKWFETANEKMPARQNGWPQANDDEPFFLDGQQALYPHNLDSAYGDDIFGAEHEGDEEKEELREVIDDLTVENKRLKKLLKSQRSTAQPHATAKDRLFDLRVHGLSAEKKRELELLLRDFTAQVNNPASRLGSAATYSSINASAKRYNSPISTMRPHQRSKPPPTDSGYGTNSHSNAHSGRDSTAVSGRGKPAVPISSSSRNNSIKSYLHDIPNTFLPRQAPFMSERAKQILVVRRLEQVFTGKQAAPGEHSQPVQQQEVSNSAAKADARPYRTAKKEGTREAHMLTYDASLHVDFVERQDASSKARSPNTNTNSTPTQPGSPDQRPTRPLDLDIQRAQVASDNIEYIRHLGLCTPHIHEANDSHDQSWIYLNLLTGMAQLHTLNVTPAFVQKAIRKMSNKFELSEDGRQVRWRGGSEGNRLPVSEDQAIESSNEAAPEAVGDNVGTSSRHLKTNSLSNNVVSEDSSLDDSGLYTSSTSRAKESTCATSNSQTSLLKVGSKPRSDMDYKPLFYRDKKYSTAASYRGSTSSPSPASDSSELVRMLSSSALDKGSDTAEGMITYYSNPFFCSDATSDKVPISWKSQRRLMSGEGLGTKQAPNGASPMRSADACYFTPQFAPKPWLGEVDESDFGFRTSPISSSGEEETQPMEMEVSGIGGVCPEDNFAVDVKILRQSQSAQAGAQPKVVALTGSRKRKRYSYLIANCEIFELQPSKLPPPTYVVLASSSSSANPDMEDSDSDASSSADEGFSEPAPLFDHRFTRSSNDESEAGEDQSGSVDMLALARAADPDRIAEQERQYILNRPPRIERSLVATVGASHSSTSADELEDEKEDVRDGVSDICIDCDLSDVD